MILEKFLTTSQIEKPILGQAFLKKCALKPSRPRGEFESIFHNAGLTSSRSTIWYNFCKFNSKIDLAKVIGSAKGTGVSVQKFCLNNPRKILAILVLSLVQIPHCFWRIESYCTYFFFIKVWVWKNAVSASSSLILALCGQIFF